MPRTEKHLVQIQLSEEQRRWIKTLASSQGMTFQQAVLQAFAAWAEKLHAKRPATSGPQAVEPKRASSQKPSRQAVPHAGTENWLQRAAKLDWTRCPDVEILAGKDRRLWVLRGTLAPLAHVLQSVAEGNPPEQVAEAYEAELPQLHKVLKFAGAPDRHTAAAVVDRNN